MSCTTFQFSALLFVQSSFDFVLDTTIHTGPLTILNKSIISLVVIFSTLSSFTYKNKIRVNKNHLLIKQKLRYSRIKKEAKFKYKSKMKVKEKCE